MAEATKKRLTKKQYANLTTEEKKARRQARMEEATASYESALNTLTNGETFREYLEASAACHNYSLRNIIWVRVQRGGQSVPPIASYDTWLKTLGYQVRKGEKGSMIWVPAPVKIEDDDGEEKRIMRFKTGRVFTRDQVDPIEGKALAIDPPTPAPITGNSHTALIPKIRRFAESNGYTIKELTPDEQPGVEGYHDKSAMVIAYRPEQPGNSIVRCLIHEVIHSLGVSYDTWGRSRAEVITDSATYLTCRMVGLDVEKTSIPYVANWAGAKAEQIGNDLGLMRKLADQVIDGANLEPHLALSEAELAMRERKSAKPA